MRTITFFSAIIIALVGCNQELPERPTPGKSSGTLGARSANAFEINLPSQACNSGDKVYALQDQEVEWISYKEADLIPVEGGIKAAGWVKGGSEGSMEIHFSPESLDSEDQLRDDRIKQYIFGLGINQDDTKFVLDDPSIISDLLENPSDEAVDLRGTLTLYGQEISVIIPTIIEKVGNNYKISNGGLAEIDLTSTSFLADKVIRLLDIADVDEMQDTVELEFEFTLAEEC